MAYSEIEEFVKEQLAQGKDATAVRQYLLEKGIDKSSIDSAFDSVYGINKNTHYSNNAQKFIGVTVVLLIILFVGVGVTLYNQLSSTSADTSIVPEIHEVEEFKEEIVNEPKGFCDFDDPELKYDCYVGGFLNEEFECSDLEEVQDINYCYRARDLYVLNA